MKLGIIGAGTIVQEFLPRLVELEGVEVVGIQSTPARFSRTEALCEANGVPHVVTGFGELCALDIDTVYVAVPNHLHFSYCRQALEKGLNVIVEKPMTSNDTQARELARIAMEKGRFLFEAVTTLHLGNYKKIQEWLPRIGSVKLVNVSYCQYSRRYDAFRAGEILPVFDPNKSGGALMDLGLYTLHFVMGLFGKPMDAVYYANVERGIDTSGTMVLRYDGFTAVCSAAKDCGGPTSVVIHGTEGYITAKYPPNLVGEVTLCLNDGTTERFDDGMAMNRVIPEFTVFRDAIDRGDRALCYRFLDKSIQVSQVQTKARLDAGIRFPCDRA